VKQLPHGHPASFETRRGIAATLLTMTGKSLMASRKHVILRSPQSGRLEGRNA